MDPIHAPFLENMVSMDYLTKYVEYYNDTGDYSEELTKLF